MVDTHSYLGYTSPLFHKNVLTKKEYYMNYTNKIIVALLCCAFGYSQQMFGYVFSFTNKTGENIKINFCGVAVGGCSMMQGKIPAWHGGGFKDVKDGATRKVNNAGHLSGDQLLPNGETVQFNFNGIDFGICIDLANVTVGLESEQFSMQKRQVESNGKEVRSSLCKNASFQVVKDAAGSCKVILQ